MSVFLSNPNKIVVDEDVWKNIDDEDLWIFDKLIVARKSGHVCGSRSFEIPQNGMYCIRPVTNFKGHSLNARIEYREKGDKMMDIHPGEFWVEKFSGIHVSVDYVGGEQELTVAGYRNQSDPLHRFYYWTKEKHVLPLPKILSEFVDKYPVINCEFIGGNLIEIHLRQNPDFLWGNSKMIPVWDEKQLEKIPLGFRYIPDNPPEEKRLGMFID